MDSDIVDEIKSEFTKLRSLLSEAATVRKALDALFSKQEDEANKALRRAQKHLTSVISEQAKMRRILMQESTTANEVRIMSGHVTDVNSWVIWQIFASNMSDPSILKRQAHSIYELPDTSRSSAQCLQTNEGPKINPKILESEPLGRPLRSPARSMCGFLEPSPSPTYSLPVSTHETSEQSHRSPVLSIYADDAPRSSARSACSSGDAPQHSSIHSTRGPEHTYLSTGGPVQAPILISKNLPPFEAKTSLIRAHAPTANANKRVDDFVADMRKRVGAEVGDDGGFEPIPNNADPGTIRERRRCPEDECGKPRGAPSALSNSHCKHGVLLAYIGSTRGDSRQYGQEVEQEKVCSDRTYDPYQYPRPGSQKPEDYDDLVSVIKSEYTSHTWDDQSQRQDSPRSVSSRAPSARYRSDDQRSYCPVVRPESPSTYSQQTGQPRLLPPAIFDDEGRNSVLSSRFSMSTTAASMHPPPKIRKHSPVEPVPALKEPAKQLTDAEMYKTEDLFPELPSLAGPTKTKKQQQLPGIHKASNRNPFRF